MLTDKVGAEEGSFFDVSVGRCVNYVLEALTGIVYIRCFDGAIVVEKEYFFVGIISGIITGEVGECFGFCSEAFVSAEGNFVGEDAKVVFVKVSFVDTGVCWSAGHVDEGVNAWEFGNCVDCHWHGVACVIVVWCWCTSVCRMSGWWGVFGWWRDVNVEDGMCCIGKELENGVRVVAGEFGAVFEEDGERWKATAEDEIGYDCPAYWNVLYQIGDVGWVGEETWVGWNVTDNADLCFGVVD